MQLPRASSVPLVSDFKERLKNHCFLTPCSKEVILRYKMKQANCWPKRSMLGQVKPFLTIVAAAEANLLLLLLIWTTPDRSTFMMSIRNHYWKQNKDSREQVFKTTRSSLTNLSFTKDWKVNAIESFLMFLARAVVWLGNVQTSSGNSQGPV